MGLAQDAAQRTNRYLSRPHLYLNGSNLREVRSLRWREVKFQRFLEIGESLFFGLTLAGNVDL